MAIESDTPPTSTQSLIALIAIVFLSTLATMMVVTVLPAFYLRLGLTPSQIGGIEGLAGTAAFLSKFLSGIFSDRIHKRKELIVWGTCLSVLSKACFALATGGLSLGLIQVGDRLAKGLRSCPLDALIADLAPPKQTGLCYGMKYTFFLLGSVLGGLATYALLKSIHEQYRIIFALATLPAGLACWIATKGLKTENKDLPETPSFLQEDEPESTEKEAQFAPLNGRCLDQAASTPTTENKDLPLQAIQMEKFPRSISPNQCSRKTETNPYQEQRSPSIKPSCLLSWQEFKSTLASFPSAYGQLLIVLFLLMFGRFSLSFLGIKALHLGLPTTDLPRLSILYDCCAALTAFLSGVVLYRIPKERLFQLALFVHATAHLVFFIAKSGSMILCGAILAGIHLGMTQSTILALIAQVAPREKRATALSLYYLVAGVGIFFSNKLAGFLNDRFATPSGAFLGGACFCLLAWGVWHFRSSKS